MSGLMVARQFSSKEIWMLLLQAIAPLFASMLIPNSPMANPAAFTATSILMVVSKQAELLV
jgi:hypothetical protein